MAERQQDEYVENQLNYIFDNDLIRGGNKKNIVENWDEEGKIYNSNLEGNTITSVAK